MNINVILTSLLVMSSSILLFMVDFTHYVPNFNILGLKTKESTRRRKVKNTPSPTRLMYQSIPSLPIPLGDPQGFAHSHCPGVGFSRNFLCSGGRGFELQKFSTVLKEKCKNSSICFKESGGSLKDMCSCVVSYQLFQKQWMFIVSLIT